MLGHGMSAYTKSRERDLLPSHPCISATVSMWSERQKKHDGVL